MFKLTLRNLLARKVRLFMSTLAIVLGIGFLTGVLTFSHGLGSTFDGIIRGSTPDAAVQPEGEVDFSAGGASTDLAITPKDVQRLAALPEVAEASGSVDGMGANLLDDKGKLVGGQGAPTLMFNVTDGSDVNMDGQPVMTLTEGAWPSKDGEITLDPSAAERGGYAIGDTVTMLMPFGEAKRQFTLTGIAEFNGGGTAGAILVLTTTHQAQQLFLDGKDVFSSVSLTAADGVSQQQLVDAANAVVPTGFTAKTGDDIVKDSQNQINQFLDVISWFLTTFAGIAILVGAFIIFNTFSILVGQRVRESALLRALGASRRQVTRSVLIEALLMALIGSTLGIGLGLLLARFLANVFSRFGLDISEDALTLTPGTVISAYVVGIIVTMFAAWIPARRAGKVAPVAAMRDDLVVQEKSLRLRTIIGCFALFAGAVLAAFGLMDPPGNDAIWIGAGAVIWVITVAVMAPVLGKPVLLFFRAVFGAVFGTPGRLAGENALRSPRRTGVTASALMIGLAVVSAVGVLASSLSATSDKLVDDQFTTDFLVSSPNFQGFSAAIGDEMAKVDGVGSVSRQQGTPAVVGKPQDKDVQYVFGLDREFFEQYTLTAVDGSVSLGPGEVLLNQTTANRLGKGVGDTLELTFPGNKSAEAKVSGVFEDTPIAGSINVPLETLAKAGLKRTDNSVSINVAPGADKDAVHEELDKIVEDLPIVTVQDKDQFADSIQGQLNQLLYFIYGLLALAVVIAVVGIVNTLGLSVIERTREIGLLRAVGLSRSRLRLMITLESVVIALLGAVLGLVLGLTVGILLRQALKDDITVLSLPVQSLLWFLLVSVLFGVLAAIVPAVRASRMKVLDAIAHE